MDRVRTWQAMRFHARAGEKLKDVVLQGALRKARPLFVAKRRKGMDSLAEDGLEFEMLRSAAKNIKNRILSDLDVWLEIFEERAKARGAEVLWARDGAEAARLVVDIAQREGVTKATKSKSMLSEEADLNAALAAAGIRPVETISANTSSSWPARNPRTSSPRPCTRPSARLKPCLRKSTAGRSKRAPRPTFPIWRGKRAPCCASIS
jgi:hypothetical protein